MQRKIFVLATALATGITLSACSSSDNGADTGENLQDPASPSSEGPTVDEESAPKIIELGQPVDMTTVPFPGETPTEFTITFSTIELVDTCFMSNSLDENLDYREPAEYPPRDPGKKFLHIIHETESAEGIAGYATPSFNFVDDEGYNIPSEATMTSSDCDLTDPRAAEGYGFIAPSAGKEVTEHWIEVPSTIDQFMIGEYLAPQV